MPKDLKMEFGIFLLENTLKSLRVGEVFVLDSCIFLEFPVESTLKFYRHSTVFRVEVDQRQGLRPL